MVKHCQTLDELLDILPKNQTIVTNAIKAWSKVNNPNYSNIYCGISGGGDSDVMLDILYRCDKGFICHSAAAPCDITNCSVHIICPYRYWICKEQFDMFVHIAKNMELMRRKLVYWDSVLVVFKQEDL